MRMKKTAALAAAGAMAVGLALASPASAATGKNGTLESGEFGLYYLAGQSGAVFDLYVSDNDFSNDVFPTTGVGANNNTRSFRNKDSFWWHVYTDANYSGSHGCIPPTNSVYGDLSGDFTATYWDTISSAEYRSTGC